MGSQAAAFIAYGTYVYQYKWSIWAKLPQLLEHLFTHFLEQKKKKNLEQNNFFKIKENFSSE